MPLNKETKQIQRVFLISLFHLWMQGKILKQDFYISSLFFLLIWLFKRDEEWLFQLI